MIRKWTPKEFKKLTKIAKWPQRISKRATENSNNKTLQNGFGKTWWAHTFGQEYFSETVSWKTLILLRSLNPDCFVFWQKKEARTENTKIWAGFCAEISHMRPIQARKLKLFWGLISDRVTPIYSIGPWSHQNYKFVFRMRYPGKCI